MKLLMTPMAVRVEAAEEAGAARGAQRGGAEGVGEAHALGGEPVDVRRLQKRMAGEAHAVPAQIVGKDEDDVGPPGLPAADERGCGSRERRGLQKLTPVHVRQLVTSARVRTGVMLSDSVVSRDDRHERCGSCYDWR